MDPEKAKGLDRTPTASIGHGTTWNAGLVFGAAQVCDELIPKVVDSTATSPRCRWRPYDGVGQP
jgi:hypothetical protein